MNCSRSAVDLSSPGTPPPGIPNGASSSKSETSEAPPSSPEPRSKLKSFGAWLQERSRSLNEVHLALKPWKKRCMSVYRRRRQQQRRQLGQQRELPALPPQTEQQERLVVNNGDLADDELANLAIDLENMAPGTAFMPDDQFDYGEKEDSGGGGGSEVDIKECLERVKECGWYWGPISGEAAERLLGPEPDGSFVVRDSSDDRYIFSLTFKLNGSIRHVRIEHEQGNFSFGTFTKFKAHSIVDFIEKAVKHSRSGRYLFFLHRRPVLGPMRVQLLHPVSRFKKVQSLQHQCRFVILKHVPRDLLHHLPLPHKLQEYLNTPFYYSETIADEAVHEERIRQLCAATEAAEEKEKEKPPSSIVNGEDETPGEN